jgi:hypothetical protein
MICLAALPFADHTHEYGFPFFWPTSTSFAPKSNGGLELSADLPATAFREIADIRYNLLAMNVGYEVHRWVLNCGFVLRFYWRLR